MPFPSVIIFTFLNWSKVGTSSLSSLLDFLYMPWGLHVEHAFFIILITFYWQYSLLRWPAGLLLTISMAIFYFHFNWVFYDSIFFLLFVLSITLLYLFHFNWLLIHYKTYISRWPKSAFEKYSYYLTNSAAIIGCCVAVSFELKQISFAWIL